jgi:hypothetical protein
MPEHIKAGQCPDRSDKSMHFEVLKKINKTFHPALFACNHEPARSNPRQESINPS